MIHTKYLHIILMIICSILFFLSACNSNKKTSFLFQVHDSKSTGLDFSNNLSYNEKFNLFKYLYFYNGAGVGAGDFNNDGFIDLFFASNQEKNKLYLNQGKLHFKDFTDAAKIPQDGGWSTGVSVVDINNDGLLDIYVCRVGNYETLHSKNQLLINQGYGKNGVPFFLDKASEYGLDFSGFSTQAAFFDYDSDGDPDMFLLTHSVHESANYRPRKEFMGTYNPLSGDRIYRNDGKNTFTDVTGETGINSSAIGYGLGIVISDINLDGYPDIYIGNDFHENDYLYINQKNGTFKDEAEQQLMHTSRYTMGVDAADVTNDGFPEIISMDMLPSDPYILKRSLGEDSYDIFNFKISIGYAYQYTRNNLQYNRRNGLFSEVGLYSGVAATDWSWAPLWLDFDNDGLKDLFISNGIPKRMNDIDYINFVSDREIQQKITEDNFAVKDLSLIKKFPVIKLPNKFYKNNGNLSFSDEDSLIGKSISTFSNGAVYADFDNDGDLDIVVSNIDASALLYENLNSKLRKKSSLQINLTGPLQNRNAIGAKVIVYATNEIRTYEKYPVKGFMSAMEIPLLVGLNKTNVDSLLVVWPDNTFERVTLPADTSGIHLIYKSNLPRFDYRSIMEHNKSASKLMIGITNDVELNYLHTENQYIEFDREHLMPHMVSTEGPAIAVADINHDGLEDVFIGSAKNKKSIVFLQQNSGRFIKTEQLALDKDSIYENTDACWADVNNDGNIDLIVASGGNEYLGEDARNSPRVYLNDGKGQFAKLDNAFEGIYITASSIVADDFNGDGYVDVFIGARSVPGEYGKIPQSYMLQNDKAGKFIDVTNRFSKDLSTVGFVTRALWFDLDKDGDKDLLLSLEWGDIVAFIKDDQQFTKKLLTGKKGWWNFMLPCDIDNDGDMDIIAGNLGLNSRLKATEKEPVRLYYNDFDGNGKNEQVLTYYLNNREITFDNKAELEKQIPSLKKNFLLAADFAKATLADLFGAEKLSNASMLTANYFANSVLINNGNFHFQTRQLPMEAQLTPFKDAVIINANDDGLPDVLMMGNYYDNNVEMGRYDADYGSILINKGKGEFSCETINGVSINGQVRRISKINIGKQKAFILARNNDSLKVIKWADENSLIKK